jgi:hypothetical protein
LYYEYSGDPLGLGELSEAAEAVWGHLSANWKSCLIPSIHFFPVKLRRITPSEDIEVTSVGASQAGNYDVSSPSADNLPEDDCVVIQRRTFLRGRENRGRIFISFVPETAAKDSTLTPVGLSTYKALATKLSDSITIPDVGTLDPATPNGKLGVLVLTKQCRVVSEIMSRRDRRNPKRPVAFAAPRDNG